MSRNKKVNTPDTDVLNVRSVTNADWQRHMQRMRLRLTNCVGGSRLSALAYTKRFQPALIALKESESNYVLVDTDSRVATNIDATNVMIGRKFVFLLVTSQCAPQFCASLRLRPEKTYAVVVQRGRWSAFDVLEVEEDTEQARCYDDTMILQTSRREGATITVWTETDRGRTLFFPATTLVRFYWRDGTLYVLTSPYSSFLSFSTDEKRMVSIDTRSGAAWKWTAHPTIRWKFGMNVKSTFPRNALYYQLVDQTGAPFSPKQWTDALHAGDNGRALIRFSGELWEADNEDLARAALLTTIPSYDSYDTDVQWCAQHREAWVYHATPKLLMCYSLNTKRWAITATPPPSANTRLQKTRNNKR